MSQEQSPVWFITECSTIFGRESQAWFFSWLARRRSPPGIPIIFAICAGHEDNALTIQLDVPIPPRSHTP